MLPTSIIGSLPRPHWYTENLGRRSFLEAMVTVRFREQHEDAVSAFLRMQEVAGIDICTNGDAHCDEDVAGAGWQGYAARHLSGFTDKPRPAVYAGGGAAFPRGHILHESFEARVLPRVIGPVGRGDLQYAAVWKTAQKFTTRPVKFGTILPELLAASVEDDYYKDPVERMWAFSDVLNAELNELADAGCPVIQMEEPMIHTAPARGKAFGKLDVDDLVKVFNNTTRGLGDKTEVWCHTCWGNPCQQCIWTEPQSYQPSLEALNTIDADVLTFETCSVGIGDLKAIGTIIKDKKVAIGVIDHRNLQVERPEEVAALIREALKYIEPERLIISSDCGMGREGMGRRHAAYKMVSMVLGTNMVRKELGLPEALCLAADPRYSLSA